MKVYTDLPQSKKLAEFLSDESADMYWKQSTSDLTEDITWRPKINLLYKVNVGNLFSYKTGYNDLPCWSLAALLGILPSATLDSSDDHHYRVHCMERFTKWHNNAIDACYEMIVKLHEQKLL